MHLQKLRMQQSKIDFGCSRVASCSVSCSKLSNHVCNHIRGTFQSNSFFIIPKYLIFFKVDAQRALLIATERRRALIFVLDRLIQSHASHGILYPMTEGPRGNLTFSDISFRLMRDFVNGYINCYYGNVFYQSIF